MNICMMAGFPFVSASLTRRFERPSWVSDYSWASSHRESHLASTTSMMTHATIIYASLHLNGRRFYMESC